MNKFDFAAGVIKASPLARLTDRAFIAPVLFSCVVWIAALSGKTTVDNAIDFTKWAIGPFVVMEKLKDTFTASAALNAGTPDVVSAPTTNINTQPVVGAQPVQAGADPLSPANFQGHVSTQAVRESLAARSIREYQEDSSDAPAFTDPIPPEEAIDNANAG